MSGRVKIPTATIDKEGQRYGGAYWGAEDMRLTLTDEGETVLVQAEDSSGNVFDEVQLNGTQAMALISLLDQSEPGTGVPQMTMTPRWIFSDTQKHLELTDELDEVAGWLKFWAGLDEWNPDDTDWEW